MIMKMKMEGVQDSVTRFLGKLKFLFRKFVFAVLSVGPIPTHIAFIMDGNRRFARKHNLKDGSGHRAGFLALMLMLRYCYELGVKYVTAYAFSVDNFNRDPEEVKHVMDLMVEKIEELLKEESIVNSYGVRLHFIGNLKLLSETARAAAEKAMAATAKNNTVVLLICVAYSSTDEIVNAVQESYNEKLHTLQDLNPNGSNDNQINVGYSEKDLEFAVKLSDLERRMYMSVSPDPDILVRTSGANRLSNFLLWQSTHTYLYSPAALWPEISLWHLIWMVLNFQRIKHNLEKKRKQL
ncbi:dehydrodolichyl diphosphate synthase 6-like [Papaver somniferum]|uniref:dehydrodolichyl diphosphate synthase 6-like n=1 Tax=Papaver somniferum TaxID=3469 RepID=UPI000E6FB54E|nr:dehydrodolichyl diphosphate synthase 6-like [Papaver somniferum]